MFETLKNAFKVKEIRKKIFITLLLLLVYRIGCYIPVPGLDGAQFTTVIEGNNFLNLMNAVTGGALANGTLFALGIGPYINASIIIQLLSVGIPALERLSKQGEEGKKKIAAITRFLTLALAIVQAIGIIINFAQDSAISSQIVNLFGNQKWLVYIYMVIVYSAGAMLTMWLGERITEYGIGNGSSLIIFVGIIAQAGTMMAQAFGSVGEEWTLIWNIIGFILIVVLIFVFIVFIDLAERRVTVQYSKQIKGNKMYGGQTTYIPIRVNGSGVMPIIFASSLLMFPQMIMALFVPNSDAYTWYATYMGSGTAVYYVLLALFILFFSYFYAQIQFNPDDVSKNIQQYGGFIPGIRAGKPTSDFLRKISNRITLFGALFLMIIALVPTFIFQALSAGGQLGFGNAFSATGLLIVVSVALELNKQLESQIMMKHYKGFLK